MTAILIGASIPLMLFGRSILQAGLAVALLMTLVLAFARQGTFQRVYGVFHTALGGMVVLAALTWLPGILNSVEPIESLKVWARTFAFIGAACLMWSLLVECERERTLALKIFLTVGVFALGAASISLLAWPELINILRARGSSPPLPELVLKSFGATAMCLFPVLIWAGRRLQGTWQIAGISGAVLAVIVIFETGNRASVAGLMAMVLLVAAILGIRDKRTRMPFLIGAPIIVSAMFLWLQVYGPTFVQNENAYLPSWLVDPHRQLIWRFTFEHAMQHPWIGYGLNTINLIPGANSAIQGVGQAYIPSHPHNWMLEIFAETGGLGLASTLFIITTLAIKLTRAVLKNFNPATNLTLLALTAGFWTSSLFNFSIWSTWWLLTYFVLFAMVAAWREPKA